MTAPVRELNVALKVLVPVRPGDAVDLEPEYVVTGVEEAPSGKATHNEDYSLVNWYGTIYRFSFKQKLVVAALWNAQKNEAVEFMTGKDLLKVAESEQDELRRLFAGGRHNAWGTMIVPAADRGGACCYRLAFRK